MLEEPLRYSGKSAIATIEERRKLVGKKFFASFVLREV